MKKIILVIGTRPNFIKITRFKDLLAGNDQFELELIHTNQHYDEAMSGIFFKQFGIEVDHFLPQFKGSPNAHFGHIIQHLDGHFSEKKPDLVIAVGDVNSTLAASIVANRLGIKVAHLESGLRSCDMGMPEEVNRILTDRITDFYFVTEPSGIENLKNENVADEKVFFVGNTMIDTLVHFKQSIDESDVLERLSIKANTDYALVTLHRPSNVDTKESIEQMLDFLTKLSAEIDIIFPMHHRTKNKIEEFGMTEDFKSIKNCTITGALDYFAFQKLIANSVIVITDSGGIQEETTFLQIPCITLRENTERPVTISEGTNTLMDFDGDKIVEIIRNKAFKTGTVPQFWDGKATERIVNLFPTILGA